MQVYAARWELRGVLIKPRIGTVPWHEMQKEKEEEKVEVEEG